MVNQLDIIELVNNPKNVETLPVNAPDILIQQQGRNPDNLGYVDKKKYYRT